MQVEHVNFGHDTSIHQQDSRHHAGTTCLMSRKATSLHPIWLSRRSSAAHLHKHEIFVDFSLLSQTNECDDTKDEMLNIISQAAMTIEQKSIRQEESRSSGRVCLAYLLIHPKPMTRGLAFHLDTIDRVGFKNTTPAEMGKEQKKQSWRRRAFFP